MNVSHYDESEHKEWGKLMEEAKALGLTVEQVRKFLVKKSAVNEV
ncbi:DNA-binding anti-repressor SinI [Salipaludibacillus keqinensis]|jgi:hypothetical protein|nr:DNA-binding anti-repressor SinI [Salipaludibacillus keqinensis]